MALSPVSSHALRRWSPAAAAAVDVLRGMRSGTVVTDELAVDGETTSQTTVLTPTGAAVLLSWVPDAEIPEARRIFVRQHLNRVRRRLNLPAVAVRYFGPPRWVEDGEVLVHGVNPAHPTFEVLADDGLERVVSGVTGFGPSWTIAVHVALSGDDLIRTIAHEARHCDQLWGSARVPESERERDAEAFADAWMAAQ